MSTSKQNITYIKQLGENKQRKFGDVWLAKDENDQLVIVKIAYKKEVTERALEQLKNERFFHFEHSSLPKVINYYEDDESCALILQHKPGVKLKAHWETLSKKERLPFIKLLSEKLMEVLNHIHQQQIYHCDIKPDNLIIHPNDIDFDLHLIDFGMAINKNDEHFFNRKLIFPLGFAAPEIILNRLDLINKTTDYFAWGISIYQLFTKELPLTHANPSVFTNLQLAHPLPKHPLLPKGLYSWLSKVCAKPQWRTAPNLMSKEEVTQTLILSFAERYMNPDELLKDLKVIKKKKWGLWG